MIKLESLLKLITNKVVIEIMKENGSDLYKETVDSRTKQKCLWFKTICHGGDSHKLCYFSQTKEFYCYTNCGKMSFFELIKRIRNVENKDFYREVVLYVANKLNYRTSQDYFGFQACKESKEDIALMEVLLQKKNKTNIEINKFYDENILNYFDRNTFYKGWIDEGISIEAMQQFGISWYEYDKHIIIPHYNQEGRLVGIRRRSLKAEDAKNKYMPEILEGLCYEHPLSLNLYGLYQNQEAIKEKRRAVVVEAEKSVLLSRTYYGKESCAVATCGFNISDWQIKALYKLGVEEIYLGFDKDFDLTKESVYKKTEADYKKFIHYKNRLEALSLRIAEYGFKVYLLIDKDNLLSIKDSPYDKGKDVLETLIRKRVEVKRW